MLQIASFLIPDLVLYHRKQLGYYFANPQIRLRVQSQRRRRQKKKNSEPWSSPRVVIKQIACPTSMHDRSRSSDRHNQRSQPAAPSSGRLIIIIHECYYYFVESKLMECLCTRFASLNDTARMCGYYRLNSRWGMEYKLIECTQDRPSWQVHNNASTQTGTWFEMLLLFLSHGCKVLNGYLCNQVGSTAWIKHVLSFLYTMSTCIMI